MATTVTLKPNAIDISGSTSGTTTLQATAVAGTTTITLPAATDTLVGKATTDTLTNKTLTSPTITGGALNGTLGATTPSTVAATTISASSTATFAAGAVGTPSITTTGDTNTGIYFPAADTIAFSEGGAESMRIDSSGNVGIGATSIAANTKLLVNGGRTNLVANSDAFALGVGYASSGAYYIGANSANNALIFSDSGGNERVRFDTSGNVGIGTSSPYKTLTVGSSDASSWITAGGNNVNLTISSIGSGGAVLFRTGGTNGDVTTTTERMRLNATGALVLAGGSTSANGIGIAFPATQSASSDANTLDDYEEGTWTPSLGGTATYSQQSGFYKKVGALVYVSAILQVATLGTGSTNQMSGFPFTCSAGPRNTLSVAYWGSTVGSLSYLAFHLGAGTTSNTVAITTAASTIQDGYGVFQNGTYVMFSGCYHAS